MSAPAHPSWIDDLFDDLFLRLCAGFCLFVLLLPPDGLEVELCAWRHVTHAPCPGCGLTRAGACLLRGELARAWQLHPFAPLLLPVIALLGLIGILPRSWRAWARDGLLPWSRRLQPLFWFGVAGFIVFGTLRWLLVFLSVATSPA
jgi:hypothetical protein